MLVKVLINVKSRYSGHEFGASGFPTLNLDADPDISHKKASARLTSKKVALKVSCITRQSA